MVIVTELSWRVEDLSEKMKEIVNLINNLDELDKVAWQELVNNTEAATQKRLEGEMDDSVELASELWEEILPLIKMVRLALASDTISRIDRCGFIDRIISELSGLLSPVELAGICFTAAFKALYTTSSRGEMMSIAIPVPFPFEDMKDEKKDETRSVV